MCNYWANRLCCEAADRAMQVHGGLGYSRHKPFEHIYRHHRRYRITEGAEEIQMRRVAGYLFGFMNQQAPKGVARVQRGGRRSAIGRARSSGRSSRSPRPTTRSAPALAEAEVPPLLPALAYLTGDLRCCATTCVPIRCSSRMPQGGLTDEQQAEARALAARRR